MAVLRARDAAGARCGGDQVNMPNSESRKRLNTGEQSVEKDAGRGPQVAGEALNNDAAPVPATVFNNWTDHTCDTCYECGAGVRGCGCQEAWEARHGSTPDIRAELADWPECHEDVTRKGESQPCNKVPVAMRVDPREGTPYPVCAYHAREPMISLNALLASLASPASGRTS